MDNKNTDKTTPIEEKVKEKNRKKERAIITTSAVFVLAGLTVTGMYISNQQKAKDPITENVPGLESEMPEQLMQTPDLEPGDLQIVDSGTVENPGRTGNTVKTEDILAETKKPATDSSNTLVNDLPKDSLLSGEALSEDLEKLQGLTGEILDGSLVEGLPGEALDGSLTEEGMLSEKVDDMSLSFSGVNMLWPVSLENNVVLPYSMDKAVYFQTLDQYKYNPAMIISAEPGTPVVAVSAGRITRKYWDYETGWTYEMDLGGGFKAYYGQLDGPSLQKAEDTYVAAGDVLGYVTSPTMYYVKEGNNLYFAMTKDGKPVYPMDYVGE